MWLPLLPYTGQVLPSPVQSLNSNHLCHLAPERRSLHIFSTDWLMANKTPKDFQALVKEKSEVQHFEGVGNCILPVFEGEGLHFCQHLQFGCMVLITGQTTLHSPGA